MQKLLEGYRAFRTEEYPQNAERYAELVASGQDPKTMIIGCCDSRVQPTTIFRTEPGDVFIVRNVANLVPPYAPDGGCHGTSAAIEYATTALDLERIVVLGHSFCGGVAAFLKHRHDPEAVGDFIGAWMAGLEAAHASLPDEPDLAPEARQRRLEHASIRTSLANLMKFPTVAARIASKRTVLVGAHFDIADGTLYVCDAQDGAFRPAG